MNLGSPAEKSGNKDSGQGEEHGLRGEEEPKTTCFAVAVQLESTYGPQLTSGPMHRAVPTWEETGITLG